MAKVYKVTISGSYRTDEIGKYADYQDVQGIIPFCDADIAKMHVIRRYSTMWIKKNPQKYPRRLNSMRQCFVDGLDEAEGELSFIGKDIKKMSWEELQDLACAKDIREIPFFQKGSLRTAQEKAYQLYSAQVLKSPIDTNKDDYNFGKLPPLFVGSISRRDDTVKLTNDEVLDMEQDKKVSPKQALSLVELKQIADAQDIKYHPSVSYDKLYERVFKKVAGA